MTVYFQSGFDTGDYSEWDAVDCPPVIDSTVKHKGTHSSRSENDLFNAYRCEKDLSGVSLAFPFYVHGWARVDEWTPTEDITDNILGPKWGAGDPEAVGGVCAALRRTAANTYYWGLRESWDFLWASSGVLLTLLKWYHVELLIEATGASLYLDGVLKCSLLSSEISNYDWLHAGAASTVAATGKGERKLWVDTILVDSIAPVLVRKAAGSIRTGLRHMGR